MQLIISYIPAINASERVTLFIFTLKCLTESTEGSDCQIRFATQGQIIAPPNILVFGI